MGGKHFHSVRFIDPNIRSLLSDMFLHAVTSIEKLTTAHIAVVLGLYEKPLIESVRTIEGNRKQQIGPGDLLK
jgi:hypothetical protein